jgi:hypothetical protein
MSAEQQACEEHFRAHRTQQPDGRSAVKLPTKMESSHLGMSHLSAERRIHAIERRRKEIQTSRTSIADS